jgi:multiple sugar transport system permease protein
MTATAARPGRVIAFTALLLGGVVMIMPIVFMLLTSLKDNSEIYELNFLPRAPTLGNYASILGRSPFGRWFLTSFTVATATTLSVLFFDSLIGYTLAKFRFRGRGIVFVAILSTLMIPTEMLVIPWYLMAKTMGWLDSIWGIMFPGMMTGFGVFLMRQFFLGVPDELIDAARVDGLGQLRVFLHIKLPLILPTIGIVSILTFVANFNAFDLIYSVKGALAGPNFASDILGTFFYRTFFGNQLQVGSPTMGATVATVMFLLILAGVCVYLFFVQRRMQRYTF